MTTINCGDAGDLRKAKDETVVLRAKLKALIERSVDKERELFDLKTKVSELAQANLLQEGEFKKKLNELTRNNKALVKERNKLAQEKNEMKEENQRLKVSTPRIHLFMCTSGQISKCDSSYVCRQI